MKTNFEKFNALALREKKQAKTKVEILKTLLKLLKIKPLEEIKVQEICEVVGISQKTFFNYFVQKEHLLTYFIQLYSFEMAHISAQVLRLTSDPIEAIFGIFRMTAKDLEENPQIMLEIIRFQSKQDLLPLHEITDAQKWHYFSDMQSVEEIEGYGLDHILPKLLREARDEGFLPEKIDIDLLFVSIVSMFYGTALLLLRKQPLIFSAQMQGGLDLIFKGAGYARKQK